MDGEYELSKEAIRVAIKLQKKMILKNKLMITIQITSFTIKNNKILKFNLVFIIKT